MPGTIALVGAGEFLEGMAGVDRYLMAQVPDPPARVVILPTAAGQEDVRPWTDMGVTHFRHLGAQVEALLVLDHGHAADPEMAEAVRRSNFVYLSGGSPGYLLHTLEGTPVWQAIGEVHARGGVLAGCSAGAMVLGSMTRVRRGGPADWDWEPGLSLLPGLAVAPHFNRMSKDRLEDLIRGAPRGHMVVGVDEHTAAVGDGARWTVMGRGSVALITDGLLTAYPSGQTFETP